MIEITRDMKDLRRAQYLCSAHFAHQWPKDMGHEVAFAGRSNVGKSSAINAIVGQARLARTSKTPGRTQQIVFFEIDPGRRLVDLPGYGYAKVPPGLQRHWEKTVRHYLESRNSLSGLILLADIRRGLTDLDRQLLKWCAYKNLYVHLLLTKGDKLNGSAANQALAKVQRDVRLETVTVQSFSAFRRVGIEEAGERVCWLYFGDRTNCALLPSSHPSPHQPGAVLSALQLRPLTYRLRVSFPRFPGRVPRVPVHRGPEG